MVSLEGDNGCSRILLPKMPSIAPGEKPLPSKRICNANDMGAEPSNDYFAHGWLISIPLFAALAKAGQLAE